MNPTFVAALVFACTFGGALTAMAVQSRLPPAHLSGDTKDVVKLGMGLVATMAALVLGLVTASAKSAFDKQDTNVKFSAAQVLSLDRVLARYGPGVDEIRRTLASLAAYRLALTWPEDASQPVRLDAPDVTALVEGINDRIRELRPETDAQRALQARALKISDDLLETRWLMLGGAGSSVPKPFLMVIVFWLTMLFASFGLFAPRNGTVIAVLLACSVSVAASLFLILEMDDPFHGVMKVSSAPIRFTIERLGR
jgi:hypothetical protein